MFTPDTCFGEFASEIAHLKCEENTLFARHPSQNFKLDRFSGGACIPLDHGAMLARMELRIESIQQDCLLNICV